MRKVYLPQELSAVSTKNHPVLRLLSTDKICRLGRESRDMGLFKDDDGKGYLLTEDVCIVVPGSLSKY
jgi:hypothetical protein